MFESQVKKRFFEILDSGRDHVETNPVQFLHSQDARTESNNQRIEPIQTIAWEWILMRSLTVLHKTVPNIYGVD